MSSPPSVICPSPTLRPALKRESLKPLASTSVHLEPPNSTPPDQSTSVHLVKVPTSTSLTPGYTNKVSFDTFENSGTAAPSDAAMFSFTLQATSEGYQKSRNTRVYLCAASADVSGSEALDWTMESLVQDGDELIVVRGFDADDLLKETNEELRDEARDLMKTILAKNSVFKGRSLSVIVEFMAGRVTETIERLIALYRPDSLVVGSRGTRSTLKTWGAVFGAPGMGSVSRYCVSHSPVPVIVVQPERNVRKSIEKRRADPKRQAEFSELLRPRGDASI